MTLAERLEQTRSSCRRALDSDLLAPSLEFLLRSAVPQSQLTHMLAESDRRNRCVPDLTTLHAAALLAGSEADTFAFERTVLLSSALSLLEKIPGLPVDDSVKHLFCREFSFYANPPEPALSRFALLGKVFPAMAGMAALVRYPAGQYQWVCSGFPRRWVLKLPLQQLLRFSWFAAFGLGGFAPCFEPHVAATSSQAKFLSEREYFKSFYRMALALEQQPAVRGIMSSSWLYSLETYRVSPHLAYMSQPYLEAGGMRLDCGPAEPASGFLVGDPARAALYEAGEYKPTMGVVVCTRKQALAWKDAHSDLASTLAIR